MLRNYLKGVLVDAINVLLACAACNFRKLVRQIGIILALLAVAMPVRFRAHNLAMTV